MEVNDELVDKLAHLARLSFTNTEKERMKRDLQQMITFVEKLNEVDTSNVEPLLFMTGEVNVLREDEVQGSVSREVRPAKCTFERLNSFSKFPR